MVEEEPEPVGKGRPPPWGGRDPAPRACCSSCAPPPQPESLLSPLSLGGGGVPFSPHGERAGSMPSGLGVGGTAGGGFTSPVAFWGAAVSPPPHLRRHQRWVQGKFHLLLVWKKRNWGERGSGGDFLRRVQLSTLRRCRGGGVRGCGCTPEIWGGRDAVASQCTHRKNREGHVGTTTRTMKTTLRAI